MTFLQSNPQSKSALIHTPSAQIPKALNQYDTAAKAIKYLTINTVI